MITAGGNIVANASTVSFNPTTGALVVRGGAGIGGMLFSNTGINTYGLVLTALQTPVLLTAQNSFAAGGLAAGTYFFKVVAYDYSASVDIFGLISGQGISSPSNELSVTIYTGAGINLSWTPVAGAWRYMIYYGSATGATNTVIVDANISGTTYTFTSAALTTAQAIPTTNTSGSIFAPWVRAGNIAVGGNATITSRLTVTGNIVADSGISSISTTTGALVVRGGIGVSGVATIGGNIVAAATTESTSATTGSIVTLGGIGAAKVITAAGNIVAAAATASTSTTTGALVVAGGAGVAGAVIAGGNIVAAATTATTNNTTGALIVKGGAAINGNLRIAKGIVSPGINTQQLSNTDMPAVFAGSGGSLTGTYYLWLILVDLNGGVTTGGSTPGIVLNGVTTNALAATWSPNYQEATSYTFTPVSVQLWYSTSPSAATAKYYEFPVTTTSYTITADTGTAGTLPTVNTTGSAIVAGQIKASGNIVAAATTVSTNATTGALVVAGGVGIAGSLYVGGSALVTGALGYGTGAGGAVTQATSRSTGVTLNKQSGSITLVTAAGTTAWTTFVVTNSTVVATDTVSLSVRSATNTYITAVTNIGAGTFTIAFQTTGGVASDTPIINFNVFKGVSA